LPCRFRHKCDSEQYQRDVDFMNILVIKFRNIGDVLLVTPLLYNLKQHYPKANIDVAINQGTESMLSLNPNVNELIIYNRDQIKALPIVKRLYKEVKFFLSFRKRAYDLVINLTEGDRVLISLN